MPNLKIAKIKRLKANEVVGLDIGALDILETEEGYRVLEINDAQISVQIS